MIEDRDDQIDEWVRIAFDSVSLPPDRIRALARQTPPKRASRGGWLLAAAAVLAAALAAWPVTRVVRAVSSGSPRVVQPEPLPEPAPELTPEPEPEPLPEPAAPARTEREAQRDQLLRDYWEGSRTASKRAERDLKRKFADDPVVIAALRLPSTRPFVPPEVALRGTEPEVQPEPTPVPVPASPVTSGPVVDMTGPWIGSTSTSQALKLTVFSQNGGSFAGEIYMQLENGTFQSFAVQGKVDGAGAFSFKGNGISFSGKVEGRGRASGSYTANGSTVRWTMLH